MPAAGPGATTPYAGGMELWIWILLVAVIVVLGVVIVATLRAVRPKAPEPLDTAFAPPSRASARVQPPGSLAPTPSDPLSPAVIAEIDALVAHEQKISAIKVLREHSGLSLREAKDQIDAWVPSASGTSEAVPVSLVGSTSRPAGAPTYAQGMPAADALTHLSPAERAEIDRLVASEQKILAIKALRQATGLSLKDAKHAIESWR